MGLFNRIKNSIEADLHGVLDTKEKKNPISLLNQYLRQSEQEVEKVRKLVERQHLLKEEFTREYNYAVELAEKRKHQVEIASRAGETELYQFALQEQTQYEERSVRLKNSLASASQHLIDLEKKYEEMKHKLKDMNIKRLEFMGRENMARANFRMNQVLDSNNSSSKASASFDELESYLERLEHQVNTSYYRNTIDSRIAQLEKDFKKEESNTIS